MDNNVKLKENMRAIRTFLLASLKELNPWQNIRTMHTNILQDIMAGVVVAIVALPLALAFGVGSGLGAVTGIWGAIAGGVIGGIFGGSLVGVSGPTGPKMVQLATIMVGYRLASGEPDLVAAFSIIFLSGLVLVVLSFLKVSRLIYYTPYSVVSGFMCGIGVIVMLLEFDSFLGLPAPHNIIEAITDIPKAITHIHPQAIAVSIPTLVVLIIWPYLKKKNKYLNKIPGPLLGLLLGTGIANIGHFDIEYIGKIPRGLPNLYIPELGRFREFLVPALSLAGLAVFDSLLTCIVADHMTGQKHSSDRETFGQGLANMTAGLVGGLTTATATMRTVANIQSGGKTPLAAVVHGLILMALVLGLGPLAEHIPMACLAAILFKVGIDILDYRILPVLHRLPLTDMLTFWIVLIVTITEDLLVAMLVGIFFAFTRFVQEISRIYKHQVMYLDDVNSSQSISKEIKDKIKLLKPQGPLFFGSIEPLESTYKEAKEHETLIIDLSGVNMMDLSGAYALENLILKTQKNNIEVIIVNTSPEIEKTLRSVRVIEHIGEDYFYGHTEDAIQHAHEFELAKQTYQQITQHVKHNLENEREVIKKATSYARSALKNPALRKQYESKESNISLFSRAIEDYFLGPEIQSIKVEGNQKKRIDTYVFDNYTVQSVKISISCLDGSIVEEGNAEKLENTDYWEYYIEHATVKCKKGIRVHVEAKDLPGNLSSKEASFVFEE